MADLATISFELVDDVATRAAAAALAQSVSSYLPTIYLQGDLGAGKTTFSQGFLAALGVTGVVRSPTYTLVEPYSTSKGEWLHSDLYRIADPAELELLGMLDLQPGETGLLVEWPDRGKGFLLPADIIVELSQSQDSIENGRKISLKAQSLAAKSMLDWMAKLL